jgi:hypothetical protein
LPHRRDMVSVRTFLSFDSPFYSSALSSKSEFYNHQKALQLLT